MTLLWERKRDQGKGPWRAKQLGRKLVGVLGLNLAAPWAPRMDQGLEPERAME